jgi:hypothetical protein
VGVIEATSEEPELDEVFPKLLVVEQRWEAQNQGVEPQALMARGMGRASNSMAEKECWECHKKGHVRAQCRQYLARQKGGGAKANIRPSISLAF